MSDKASAEREDIGFERWRCNERPADLVHMRGNQDNELWWNEESLRAAWIAARMFASSAAASASGAGQASLMLEAGANERAIASAERMRAREPTGPSAATYRLTDRLRELLRSLYGGINDSLYGELDRIDAFGSPSATTVRSVVEKIIHDLDAEGRASVVVAWGRQDGEPTIRKWLDEWVKKNASDRNIP